jgi:ubiquitin-protein ligase E3 B
MESCQHYVVTKQSNLTHWHPVLGWFAQSMDYSLHEAMPYVKTQLYLLWSGPVVSVLLGQTLSELVDNATDNGSEGPCSSSSIGSSNILRRALDHRTNRTNAAKHHRKLGSPECTKVALLCSLYQTALGTLTQLKLDILTG